MSVVVLQLAAEGLTCDEIAPRRGDADCDESVGLTDGLFIFDYLFRRGSSPSCPDAADANDDGLINAIDVIAVLLHSFGDVPLPEFQRGFDATLDALGCGSGTSPCPPGLSVRLQGWIGFNPLRSPSAIEASELQSVLWLLNDLDAGQAGEVFALSLEAEHLVTLSLCIEARCRGNRLCANLEVIPHCDWEGLALGPSPLGEHTLFVGDIGGRPIARRVFAIHRLPEPLVLDHAPGTELNLRRERGDFDTLFFEPPGNRPHDFEGLFVDPNTAELYLIAQEPFPALFRYPMPQRPGEVVTLEMVATIPDPGFRLGFVKYTAADISSDGSLLMMKRWDADAETSVFVLDWDPLDPARSFSPGPKCRYVLNEYLGSTFFHAGNASFAATGQDVLTVEEAPSPPIYRLERP